MEYIVNVRQPSPPHAIIAQFPQIGVRYGFALMRAQKASFRIARSDANISALGTQRVGLLATIERADGLLPFVGFVTGYTAARADPEVSFELTDHTWLLSQAVTQKSGSFSGTSGALITATLREINGRGTPPLPFSLGSITGGPVMDYDYRLTKADQFLAQVAQFTGWEWGWSYDVSRESVRTALAWSPALGADVRNAVIWEEDIHLSDVSYGQRADGYVAAAVAVGGSGAMSDRPAGAVSALSAPVAGVTAVPIGSPILASPALRGTRALLDQQVTDTQALIAAARRLQDAPENAAETLSFKLAESEIDMARVAVGNIITVRLADTDLGSPLARTVRILAVQIDADTGVHDVEGQVL